MIARFTTAELLCGCRPADRWCSTAERLRRQMSFAAARFGVAPTRSQRAEARLALAFAEQALHEHLAPAAVLVLEA